MLQIEGLWWVKCNRLCWRRCLQWSAAQVWASSSPRTFWKKDNGCVPGYNNGRKHFWVSSKIMRWTNGRTWQEASGPFQRCERAPFHSRGMAKPFFRPQKFLRRTQCLLFFLTAAYLMAGSLLLLQRSRLVLQQSFRGTSGNQPLPVADIMLSAGDADSRLPPQSHFSFLVNMKQLHGPTPDHKYGPRWLMSRNSELRQLRRRWFLRFINEQEPIQAMGMKIEKPASESRGKVFWVSNGRRESGAQMIGGGCFKHLLWFSKSFRKPHGKRLFLVMVPHLWKSLPRCIRK